MDPVAIRDWIESIPVSFKDPSDPAFILHPYFAGVTLMDKEQSKTDLTNAVDLVIADLAAGMKQLAIDLLRNDVRVRMDAFAKGPPGDDDLVDHFYQAATIPMVDSLIRTLEIELAQAQP